MGKLALLGGKPVRTKPFPKYNTIGEEEKKAVKRVLDTGILSDFVGSYGPHFLGGKEVQELERMWCEYFGVKYAIAVNSATSGLHAAVGAVGVGPGDEVIVPAVTMSATCMSPLVYNAIPVFADIEPDYLCLDPQSVRQKITPRTKAIMAVDLAGQSVAMEEIKVIAQEHHLKIIEDNAQAPGALYKGKLVGTMSDIAIFSLNCHKTIQSGEGGVVVTNDAELAKRVRRIRNHAEAVLFGMPELPKDISNMIGWNYRMPEIEAAIGQEQLKKLSMLNEERIKRVEFLNEKLSAIKGIKAPQTRKDCTHVYYVQALRYDEGAMGIDNETFVKAIYAEADIPSDMLWAGWGVPLYLLPIFQQQIAYGKEGCPFRCSHYEHKLNYDKGACPVAEDLYKRKLIVSRLFYPPLSEKDLCDIVNVFEKIADNVDELKEKS